MWEWKIKWLWVQNKGQASCPLSFHDHILPGLTHSFLFPLIVPFLGGPSSVQGVWRPHLLSPFSCKAGFRGLSGGTDV